MSMLEKVRAPGRSKSGATYGGGLPQVNLLPPEVLQRRSLSVVKRWLVIGLAIVVAGIGLAYVGATFVRSSAENELADAQADSLRLKGEQAKYAEVPRVLGQLANANKALQVGFSTEVLWKPYLDAVTSVLPEDVSLETFAITGPTPLAAPAASADPLQAPSIGSIAFEGRSLTIPDAADLIDALDSVPGFADAAVSSASVTEEDGDVYYVLSASVQLDAGTLANRFVPKPDEEKN